MNTNSHFSILVIEDQLDISELIKLQLELQSYEVTIARNLKIARDLASNKVFHLFLIDRMLPDGSGLELCEEFKSSYPETPIIFVTALSEPENIIEGLDAGANDYITKPFDINILQARVRANLRHLKETKPKKMIHLHSIELDDEKKTVFVEKESINLTLSEFNILKLLMSKPGIVHTRKELINKILGEEIHVTNRVIDTHLVGLRKKIKSQARWIETIRGVGYRFNEHE